MNIVSQYTENNNHSLVLLVSRNFDLAKLERYLDDLCAELRILQVYYTITNTAFDNIVRIEISDLKAVDALVWYAHTIHWVFDAPTPKNKRHSADSRSFLLPLIQLISLAIPFGVALTMLLTFNLLS